MVVASYRGLIILPTPTARNPHCCISSTYSQVLLHPHRGTRGAGPMVPQTRSRSLRAWTASRRSSAICRPRTKSERRPTCLLLTVSFFLSLSVSWRSCACTRYNYYVCMCVHVCVFVRVCFLLLRAVMGTTDVNGMVPNVFLLGQYSIGEWCVQLIACTHILCTYKKQ